MVIFQPRGNALDECVCVCESHASGAPLNEDWARGLFDEQRDCYILKQLKDGAVLHLRSGGEEALAATLKCVCVCVYSQTL